MLISVRNVFSLGLKTATKSLLCFYVSGSTLQTVYLYLVNFYLAAFEMHYAFR